MSQSAGGLLLIDKPAGITSFDVIYRLRRQTGIRKIGHAGTLDPMATGLLLILVGNATKQSQSLTKLDKTYRAEIHLGATSSTGDREGKITPVSGVIPSQSQIMASLNQFVGEISQAPPIHSAIKVGGVRAYKLARRGRAVTMPPRQVTINRLTLEDYDYPKLTILADVSSGTYIRSLAADLGSQLGTGAYLSALRRLTIGQYQIEDALTPDHITAQNLDQHLMKLPVG